MATRSRSTFKKRQKECKGATMGTVSDKCIKADNALYPIQELAFDPREATYLINNIQEIGRAHV